MTARFLGVLLLLAFASPIRARPQDHGGMVPFSMDPRSGALAHSPVDVSFLLDAPAGKRGFVTVRDGHLATSADGSRIRLWGVNITDWSKGSRQIPSREDAPFVAETLARFGVNAVRLQFLDLQVPRGLVAAGENTRSLDPEALDREDFFIAELEKRGIYIDFNLLVGRPFQTGDSVSDPTTLHEGAKGTSLFDARLIQLQKEYANQLLGHLNPYTHHKYTADPGVAIVEINNENAINVGFHAPSTFYATELTAIFNRWLETHRNPDEIARLRAVAGTGPNAPVPLIAPRAASTATPERFHTEAEFYTDLQRTYFEDFERYLKQTLGLRSLVIATADHNHAASGYPVLLATTSMDIIDGHTYWQHPEYYVHKLPMVNDPFNSTVVELSRSAIQDKPYTVSEVNNPFPNDYAGEGIPILAAYAAFQDWDGVFWYTYEPKPDPKWKPYIGDPFDISRDPVKMPELAAGALLFLRGDVDKAQDTVTRSYSRTEVFDSMLLPSTDRPYFTRGFPLQLPLQHEVRISSLDGPPTASFSQAPSPNPIVSDTGQLRWFLSPQLQGLVSIDTPRTQALIGFTHSQNLSLSIMTPNVENTFCTVVLSSLDDLPIARATKLLLVAAGTVRNTGQQWNSAGTDVTQWGGPPTLIALVRGSITLRGLAGARAVQVQPIDGAGQPLGEPAAATRSGDAWTVPLGSRATTWYTVEISR